MDKKDPPSTADGSQQLNQNLVATSRESEKKYLAILDGVAEGILIADIETRKFNYANPMMCSMLGYSAAELTQLSVNDIHPPENLPAVLALFTSLARGEIRLAHSVPCKRKDGIIFWAYINND